MAMTESIGIDRYQGCHWPPAASDDRRVTAFSGFDQAREFIPGVFRASMRYFRHVLMYRPYSFQSTRMAMPNSLREECGESIEPRAFGPAYAAPVGDVVIWPVTGSRGMICGGTLGVTMMKDSLEPLHVWQCQPRGAKTPVRKSFFSRRVSEGFKGHGYLKRNLIPLPNWRVLG